MINKTPPNNLEIEKQCLYFGISKEECLIELMNYESKIFYYQKCRFIFEALKDLYNAGYEIDLNVVSKKLYQSVNYPETKDIFAEVVAQAGTGSYNFRYIIDTLIELYKKRKIMEIGIELFDSVNDGEIDYEEFEKRILNLQHDITHHDIDDYKVMSEVLKVPLDETFENVRYYKTGIGLLDKKIQGVFDGQFCIIGGRQKKGKTSLAIQIALGIKMPVLFFSLEMLYTEIYSKMIASMSSVEAWRIETRKMDDTQMRNVLRAHSELQKKIEQNEIIIFDRKIDYFKIINTIKYFKQAKGIKVAIIDYLQLIPGGIGKTRYERYTDISQGIKNLAHELGMPIIALSQLSRECEKQNRRPISSDLRETGGLEQDADLVVFVHEEDGSTELIVAENRKGATGIIKGLNFEKKYSRFNRIDYSEDEMQDFGDIEGNNFL